MRRKLESSVRKKREQKIKVRLLSTDGTSPFCPVLNNSCGSGQRFIEPSVLSLMIMVKVQETGKQRMILPQATSPSSSVQQFSNFHSCT